MSHTEKHEIDSHKTYQIPKDISVIQYNGKILIIAPDTANWIVLNTLEQLNVFNSFKEGHSIKFCLADKSFNSDDVTYVVTQIEARKLCTKKIHKAIDDERGIHLYLTNSCNLCCPHCYMFSGKANKDELTTEEIKCIIDDYKRLTHYKYISFSGGEPSLRHDFDELVKYAAESGLKVKVFTNGTLFTPNRVEKLANYINSVQISIDGFSEISNSIIRGKGNFEKALLTVDLFIHHGIDTSIAITPPFKLLEKNYYDYIKFTQMLMDKYQGKTFHIKYNDKMISGRKVRPSKYENLSYYNLIKKIQEHIYGQDYEIMNFVRTLYDGTIITNCKFGVFAIASNGDVYMCARTSDLIPIANVRTTPFEMIYKESLIAEKNTLVSNLKPCRDCELRYICGGGCRIEEFPELTKRTSFENINNDSYSTRKCNQTIKEKFYELMINSNEYFYTSIE